MLTRTGPRVVEFNARLGDPETQPTLLRLAERPGPGAAGGGPRRPLRRRRSTFDPRAAVGVVLAAEGYPGTVTKGDAISGLEGPFERGRAGVPGRHRRSAPTAGW